jgi:hypothetical protein
VRRRAGRVGSIHHWVQTLAWRDEPKRPELLVRGMTGRCIQLLEQRRQQPWASCVKRVWAPSSRQAAVRHLITRYVVNITLGSLGRACHAHSSAVQNCLEPGGATDG